MSLPEGADPTGKPASAQVLLRGCGLEPREARTLLAQVLGCTREYLLAHPDASVQPPAAARFHALADQRRDGVPMAYLVGLQEFYGHQLQVGPAVLIPRPETELLVDTALSCLAGRSGARVLDLGTGSGAIAIALALARPDLFVVASDRSIPALRLAHANSARLGAGVRFFAGDWLAPLAGRFTLIVSNPPYIRLGDPHLEALRHEPYAALSDAADGLRALRTLTTQAPGFLEAGGHLLLEHGYDQGAATRQLMAQAGFTQVQTLPDLAGRERACLGMWGNVLAPGGASPEQRAAD